MEYRYEFIKKIVDDIKSKCAFEAEIAIILGSGLGVLTEHIDIVKEIKYEDIIGFPTTTVKGHAGKIVFGYLEGKKVAAFSGRIHYYECKDMEKATLITKIIKVLGINKLILTNAAGGINAEYNTGDIMAITDHISSFVPSPLLGPNIEELGTRFPDMTNVYNMKVVNKVKEYLEGKGIKLQKGVYVQTSGPNYETPAEINMFRMLGASAVGMSTVCEAMVAKHMGMDICAFSCITNMAAGIGSEELSHEEVGVTARKASNIFVETIKATVKFI